MREKRLASKRYGQATYPRVCEWCWVAFDALSPSARGCCGTHGVYVRTYGPASQSREIAPWRQAPRIPTDVEAGIREARRPKFVSARCPWCASFFVSQVYPGSPSPRFCQEACSKRHHKAKRRSRLRGAAIVRRRLVFDRDRWRCWICEAEALDVPVPDPLAATLDHIIPLSLGGMHEESNVMTAHFACNARRGNSMSFKKLPAPPVPIES